MKKTKQQKDIIRDSGAQPLFWTVVHENDRFLHIRNWITGENRVFRKEAQECQESSRTTSSTRRMTF